MHFYSSSQSSSCKEPKADAEPTQSAWQETPSQQHWILLHANGYWSLFFLHCIYSNKKFRKRFFWHNAQINGLISLFWKHSLIWSLGFVTCNIFLARLSSRDVTSERPKPIDWVLLSCWRHQIPDGSWLKKSVLM